MPDCSNTPRALALIHQGRCGSTVLGYLLDQHPCIYWDGEALLHHRNSERWLRRLQGARGKSGRNDLKVLMRYARGRTYVVSAKGAYTYSSTRHLVDDLLVLGFNHFVVLERENTLRRVVSAMIGMQHKVWVLPRGRSAKLRQVQVPISFDNGETLVDRIRFIRNWYADARKVLAGLPTLELTYEKHILDDPRVAYRSVCDFLGVEVEPARIKFKRLNPFPLQHMVSNFEEVESVLHGTEFEWMLGK